MGRNTGDQSTFLGTIGADLNTRPSSPPTISTPTIEFDNAETGEVTEEPFQFPVDSPDVIIARPGAFTNPDDVPEVVRKMTCRMAIGETVLHRLARLGYEVC